MDGFSVDTAEVRSHAENTEGFAGRADTAADAGAHLTSLDDAYGLFCRPFGQMLVEPQTRGTEGLAKAAAMLHDNAAKLDQTALAYEEFDKRITELFEQIGEILEDGPGFSLPRGGN